MSGRYEGAFLFPSVLMVYIFCTSKSIRNFVADGSINTDGSIITDGSKAMGGKVFMGGKVMGGKAFKTLKRLRTISHLGVTDLETDTTRVTRVLSALRVAPETHPGVADLEAGETNQAREAPSKGGSAARGVAPHGTAAGATGRRTVAGATETMKGVAKQGYANVAAEVATVTVKGFAKLKGIAHVERKKGLREADLVDDEMVHHVNAVDGADPRVLNRSGPEKKSWMACPDGQIPSKPMRLIKWEKIFYQIDSTLRGYLHEEEALGFFTFIRLDLSKEGIKRFVRYAARGGDQMLVLSEFVDVSEILLSQVSGERTTAAGAHSR